MTKPKISKKQAERSRAQARRRDIRAVRGGKMTPEQATAREDRRSGGLLGKLFK